MTVKEILLSCATCLGREEIIKYLSDTSSDADTQTISAVSNMVSLLNMVLCELATSFIPMVYSEKISFYKGSYKISSFKKNAIEIIELLDDYGQKVDYKIVGENILSNVSKANVTYQYLPENYGLDDVIGYAEKDVSKMTLTCGLAAEFSISEGSFSEAVMWHKRYVEGVNSIFKPRNVKTKSRYWL